MRDQQSNGEKVVVTPTRNDRLISLIYKQASKNQEEKDQQKNVQSLWINSFQKKLQMTLIQIKAAQVQS